MLPETSTTYGNLAGVMSMPCALGLGHYKRRGLSLIGFSPGFCHVPGAVIAPVRGQGPTRAFVQRSDLSPQAGG